MIGETVSHYEILEKLGSPCEIVENNIISKCEFGFSISQGEARLLKTCPKMLLGGNNV